MPAPAQQQQTLYPARLFERPIWVDLGAKAITLGGAAVSWALRQLGYLDMLVVHLSGTYTVANANLVFGPMGAYQAVTNFLLQPPGQQPPINIGGANMHVWNLVASDFAPFKKAFRFAAQGTLDANAYHASIVDQVPVAVGAQTLHLWWVIPAHMDASDNRGALPLGNSTVTNFIVTPDTIADWVTVAANFTLQNLSVDVAQVYMTPPPDSAPIISGSRGDLWSVVYDETYQAVPAVGLQKVEITPQDTILGILHAVTLNGALDSTDVTNMYLRVNQSFFTDPAGLSNPFLDMKQAFEQGVPLPVGFFLWDENVLAHALAYGFDLGQAGWIHTQDVTELESGITIAAGATLGAAPRIYTSTRRLRNANPAGAGIGAG